MKYEHLEMIDANLTELETPLCNFWIEKAGGARIPFDVFRSSANAHDGVPTKYTQDGEVETFMPIALWGDYVIRIDIRSMPLQEKWTLCTSRVLEYMYSDICLSTYGLRNRKSVLAISIPDPNDETWYAEIQGLKVVKRAYNIDWLDSGFEISLYDHSSDYIHIPVAWILNIPLHSYDAYAREEIYNSYSDTAQIWTWHNVWETI